MKIEVLLFAQLKETYGSGYLSMEVPAGAKVSDAVQMVLGKKQLRLFGGLPLRYAVNEEFKPADSLLKEGDCLALLSPVAGG